MFNLPNAAVPTGDVECHGAIASECEWREVRATAVAVAERAAFLGYASDRFGDWEVCGQRRSLGQWPPGLASVQITLIQRQQRLVQWLAHMPAMGHPS